jgi:molecular chaperone DnaK (HSP70)
MARARFSIGIDLGTTNSALAFAPLVGEATPEILLVPQWESLAGLAEEPTLPSFLYLPEDAVAAHFRARSIGAGQWIIGHFAREGGRNARTGRPFREVLALPSLCRPVGAVPAMGIAGSDA